MRKAAVATSLTVTAHLMHTLGVVEMSLVCSFQKRFQSAWRQWRHPSSARSLRGSALGAPPFISGKSQGEIDIRNNEELG